MSMFLGPIHFWLYEKISDRINAFVRSVCPSSIHLSQSFICLYFHSTTKPPMAVILTLP